MSEHRFLIYACKHICHVYIRQNPTQSLFTNDRCSTLDPNLQLIKALLCLKRNLVLVLMVTHFVLLYEWNRQWRPQWQICLLYSRTLPPSLCVWASLPLTKKLQEKEPHIMMLPHSCLLSRGNHWLVLCHHAVSSIQTKATWGQNLPCLSLPSPTKRRIGTK